MIMAAKPFETRPSTKQRSNHRRRSLERRRVDVVLEAFDEFETEPREPQIEKLELEEHFELALEE